jgi:hypothetical protein
MQRGDWTEAHVAHDGGVQDGGTTETAARLRWMGAETAARLRWARWRHSHVAQRGGA